MPLREPRLGAGCVTMLLLVVLWQVVAWSGLVRPIFLSSPIAIGRAMFGMDGRQLADAAWISARTFGIGMAVTIAVGVPAGLALGMSRALDAAFSPLLAVLQATPRVAFAPMLILWLGIGPASVVALIVMNAVVLVVATTATGVRQADPAWRDTAVVFGATRWQTIRMVLLPGSVPHVLSGVRLAVGRGLLSMVVGEFLTSTGGLGYLIRDYASTFQTDRMFVGIIIVTTVGVLLDGALARVERRLQPWRPA